MKLLIILLTACVLSCNVKEEIIPLNVDLMYSTYVHNDQSLEFKENIVNVYQNGKLKGSFKYVFINPKLLISDNDNIVKEGKLTGQILSFNGLNYIKR